MNGKSLFPNLLLMAALVLAMAPTAFADGKAKHPAQDELPGVQGDYRIVQPMPEPDDGPVPASPGQFKVGNTDVRIGGSVRVDIGVGSLPPPRR